MVWCPTIALELRWRSPESVMKTVKKMSVRKTQIIWNLRWRSPESVMRMNSDKNVREENTNNNKSDELSTENYTKNQLNILLDEPTHDDIEAVLRSLLEIQDISPSILLETCAGQVVQILRAHSHDIIAGLATEILTKWKIIVDEWSESTLSSQPESSAEDE